MAPKTYLRSDEEKKLVFGFTFTFFDMHVDLERWSEEELRSHLNAAWELFLLDPHPVPFIDTLWRFFDELDKQGKPASEIGLYISKHLTK